MSLVDKLLSLIAPHHCLVCQTEGALLCAWCREGALPVASERCFRCGTFTPDFATCPACPAVLSHVWTRTTYHGTAKQLVKELKFDFARDAAQEMAVAMQEALPYLSPDTILVHIPTASRHVRQRGFDHAALIARELAGLSHTTHLTLLARTGQKRQVGSKRAERLVQQHGAFRTLSPERIKGAHIVLVDDVLTTGGTLEAAARTLREAGASSVDAAVFTFAP